MGRTLFFYGSLRYRPLLEIVLGPDRTERPIRAAVLEGYAARAVKEGPFPTLLMQQGACAEGLVVSELSDEDIARLDFYEGGFDYDLVPVTLKSGEAAEVYVSPPGRWTALAPWDLGVWSDAWGEMSCHAAREVMGYFGQRTAAQVAVMFPQIRARAWSRVLAGRQTSGQVVFEGALDIKRQHRAYAGFFALDEITLRHERFDGSMSEVLQRSYFVGCDAALVLPYDPVRDRVLMIEQMRVGPFGRGDPEIWHLEPIAGRIDPGETPEQTAHREAFEEAGVQLDRLETVARCYASPGNATDFFHIFVGLTALPDGVEGIHGLPAEAEDIRSRVISFEHFLEMAEDQRTANTPLALLAYWLAHHRTRLRS